MSFQLKHITFHRHPPSGFRQQQGMVIVVALMIVALVATMGYLMMARLERDTMRTQLLLRNAQAEHDAQGSIAWAIDQLKTNWEKQKPKQLVDKLPIQSPEVNENGYKIISTIYDMQARYNINNLALPDEQLHFKHLLQAVMPNMLEHTAAEITRAISHWIAPGKQDDEFNKYYLQQPQPYSQSHQAMVTISELRLVRGVSSDIYKALQPYITALPPSTPINVENAPVPVLMSLSPKMTLDAGNVIEQTRKTAPFTSTEAFLNLEVVKNRFITADRITVVSTYFLVETKVTIEKQHIVLYTLLQRGKDIKDTSINIVWQSKGTW